MYASWEETANSVWLHHSECRIGTAELALSETKPGEYIISASERMAGLSFCDAFTAKDQGEAQNKAVFMAAQYIRDRLHRWNDLDKAFQAQIGANPPFTVEELQGLPLEAWFWIEILDADDFQEPTVSAYYSKQPSGDSSAMLGGGYPGLPFSFRFKYESYGKSWRAFKNKPERSVAY